MGQGTGLGLALSYGLVRDMGGKIVAANGRHGAVFSVYLPLVEAKSVPMAPLSAAAPA
ncbi:hypothetical protein [Benzoatithermus flavus]|uniref:Histidine kinase n=1 Tax=Benzoatithermus flavus TaxID=3108223 RepID=A0ABU8XT02_9PROT